MELQIQDLISSIRKEGVDAAQQEADSIIARAKEQAAAIVADTQSEAQKITEKTSAELETMKESARESARQAQRDALLSFKESLQKEFETLLASDVTKTVKNETLGVLIKAVLSDENPSAYTAEVTEITEGLKGELAAELNNGLELKLSSKLKGGFRLSSKDGSGYFDCSDEELAAMLRPFFSELNI